MKFLYLLTDLTLDAKPPQRVHRTWFEFSDVFPAWDGQGMIQAQGGKFGSYAPPVVKN